MTYKNNGSKPPYKRNKGYTNNKESVVVPEGFHIPINKVLENRIKHLKDVMINHNINLYDIIEKELAHMTFMLEKKYKLNSDSWILSQKCPLCGNELISRECERVKVFTCFNYPSCSFKKNY